MIRTSKELSETLDYIINEKGRHIGGFSNNVSSAEYNNIFEAIENNLNILYEKTRHMQELREFIYSFVQITLKDKINAIEDNIINAQKSLDLYIKDKTLNDSVVFNSSSAIAVDRDGTPLQPTAFTSSKVVFMASNIVNTVDNDNITCITTSNNIAYKRLCAPLNKYYSFYLLESPSENGIQEILYIMIKTPQLVNTLNLSVFTCKIESITLITESENNIVLQPQNSNIYVFQPSVISKIFIKLKDSYFKPYSAEVIQDNNDMLPLTSLETTIFETTTHSTNNLHSKESEISG